MFGIGMPEMLLILAIALIVIGPKKLPDLAKSLGRALGEFKRATSDLKDSIQMETGLDDVKTTFDDIKGDLKDSVIGADDLDIAEDDKHPATSTASSSETPMDNVKSAFDALNQSPEPAVPPKENGAPAPKASEDLPANDSTPEKDPS